MNIQIRELICADAALEVCLRRKQPVQATAKSMVQRFSSFLITKLMLGAKVKMQTESKRYINLVANVV